VLKRASLSAKSRLSGTKTRPEWLRTNALALGIRLFVNAAAFSYWISHPGAATHLFGSAGLPVRISHSSPATPQPQCSTSRTTA
jgi:hypothetical protein